MTEPTLSRDAIEHVRVSIPEHVVFREFDTDTVLLNLRTGQYHGLNKTAGRMLEHLQQTGSPKATSEAIATEFRHPQDDVLDDLVELCNALAERGLIEIHAPSEA